MKKLLQTIGCVAAFLVVIIIAAVVRDFMQASADQSVRLNSGVAYIAILTINVLVGWYAIRKVWR